MPEDLLNPSNGLSNTRLQETTATESDVLSGKTFYSGDDTLRTGTGKICVHIGRWGAHHNSHVTSATFDVKSKLPNDYMNLTNDNFILGNPSIFASHGAGSAYDTTGFRWNYNSQTGILSCNADNGSWVYECRVWCMMPDRG